MKACRIWGIYEYTCLCVHSEPSETRSRSIEENTRLRSRCETSVSRREVGALDSFRFLDVAPLLVISLWISTSSRNGRAFAQVLSRFSTVIVRFIKIRVSSSMKQFFGIFASAQTHLFTEQKTPTCAFIVQS